MKLKITLIAILAIGIKGLTAQCGDALFEEQNGIAVLEMESGNLPSNWERETGEAGFTGNSFIAWRGSDFFNSPGNGVIEYKVRINNPGTYRFVWRSQAGVGNSTTEHNDSWLRFPDADDFFAVRGNGSSTIFPRGSGRTPNPNGSSSNGWFKIYVNNLNWDFRTVTSDNDPHNIFATFNSPGVYTIQVSGRSFGHFIDRMVLYNEDNFSFSNATQLSRQETLCDGSNPDPDPDPTPDLEIDLLELFNSNNSSLGNLTNGRTINLADINNTTLGVEAITSSSSIGSVEFVLTGPLSVTRTENVAPYSLFGGSGDIISGETFPEGSYTITAVPYSGRNRGGEQGEAFFANFTVIDEVSNPDPDPDPTPDLEIDLLELFNSNNSSLGNLTNGRTINLADINNTTLGVEAITSSSSIGSVEFVLTGPLSVTRTENVAPYSLFGGSGDIISGETFPEGSYTITAVPYSGSNRSGEQGEAFFANFTVIDEVSNPDPDPNNELEIESVLLINADTNASIGELTNGRQINLNSLGNPDFSANAIVSEEVVSVRFQLTGPGVNSVQTENIAPYTLFGDSNGNFNGISFAPGSYQLSVTPYAGRSASGEQGETLEIPFTVVETMDNDDESTLFLVNSSTDQDISELTNGLQIDAGVAQNINIRVDTDVQNIGSVGFEISGGTSISVTENIAPYAIFGDFGGNDFRQGSLGIGNYNIEVTLYSGRSRSGNVLEVISSNFSVVGQNNIATATLFPNPVSADIINIATENPFELPVNYAITNVSGIEVNAGTISPQNGSTTMSIPVPATLAPGIYHITFYEKGNKKTISFIKE